MKSMWESKTVWFNIIMMIVLSTPIIAAQVKAIDPAWAVLADSIGGLIVGIGNVILRVWYTDTPIDTPKARKAETAKAELEQRINFDAFDAPEARK